MDTPPNITQPISLPIRETLNLLPEVTWDRWSGDGTTIASVFGWIDRDDGRSDFVHVVIGDGGPWSIATSSAKYSAEFSSRLLGEHPDASGHYECQRVEDHFEGVKCVHLKDKV